MAGVSSCWDREELLSGYLDGELTSGELAEVVAHLDGCTDCIAVFRRIQEARSLVRQLPDLDLPSALAAALHLGDLLSAYLDGELSPQDVEHIGDHLALCAPCRSELRELDAARTAVRALPRLEPSLEPPPLGASTARRRWARRAVAAAAVAAAIALVVNTGGPAAFVDRDTLANRHTARTSVEQGFAVIPAFATPAETP